MRGEQRGVCFSTLFVCPENSHVDVKYMETRRKFFQPQDTLNQRLVCCQEQAPDSVANCSLGGVFEKASYVFAFAEFFLASWQKEDQCERKVFSRAQDYCLRSRSGLRILQTTKDGSKE